MFDYYAIHKKFGQTLEKAANRPGGFNFPTTGPVVFKRENPVVLEHIPESTMIKINIEA